MEPTVQVLGPAVAGTWYPADGDALDRQVAGYLRAAKLPEDDRAPIALIEPHAGFVYSGQVAAHGFRLLEGRAFERVIVLGPSHYASFRGAAVPRAERYRTPLGDVPLDVEGCAALAERPGFQRTNHPFGPEHSLEAELPFLQRVLAPGWRLLPVLIGGGLAPESAAEVAAALRPLLEAGSLAVVSSDFTHYGPRFNYVPFRDDVPDNIRRLDMGAIRHIEAGDVQGFEEYVARTDATICGRGAIDVLMRALPGGARGSLIAYDTSGNQTGDWDHSVSYASLSFHPADERPRVEIPPALAEEQGDDLGPDQRATLLRLARAAIGDRLRDENSAQRLLEEIAPTGRLAEAGASFVTLRIPEAPGGRLGLRGCIGSLAARAPLYRDVMDNAVKSAFQDPRFAPLSLHELDLLRIGISVLTPLRPVAGPEAIVIGRDGVQLDKDGRRSVFLPQVAVEQRWDVPTLLEQLAKKAGLPAAGWRGGKLATFRSESFGED